MNTTLGFVSGHQATVNPVHVTIVLLNPFEKVSHAPRPLLRHIVPSDGPVENAHAREGGNRDMSDDDPANMSSMPPHTEQSLASTDQLHVGEFASIKLDNADTAVHCRVEACLDEAAHVYRVTLAQTEVSRILCCDGRIRRVSDTRGDAYVVYHPAFPAEFGLQSGQKWFSVHSHGGDDAAKRLAETSLQRWTSQFRQKAIASLSVTIALSSEGQCSAVGAQTGEVHTCSEWAVIRPDSFDGRLLQQSGVWSPEHSSQCEALACIVRSLLSKRALKQVSDINTPSLSPSKSGKQKSKKGRLGMAASSQ